MRIALVNAFRTLGGGAKRALRAAHDFSKRGHNVTVIGPPGGPMEASCREEGYPFRPAALAPYWSPGAIRELAAVLRTAEADAAVCYDERCLRIGALAAPLARTGRGTPAVVYYYGLV